MQFRLQNDGIMFCNSIYLLEIKSFIILLAPRLLCLKIYFEVIKLETAVLLFIFYPPVLSSALFRSFPHYAYVPFRQVTTLQIFYLSSSFEV